MRETLLAVKDQYDAALHCGLACGLKNCGIGNGMADWCEVEIEVAAPDRVIVRHGWTEMGQGVHTVALQVVAEATGIDPALIEVPVDTADGAGAGMTTLARHLAGGQRAHRRLSRPVGRSAAARPGRSGGHVYEGEWRGRLDHQAGGMVEKVYTHYSYSYATQLVILDEEGLRQKDHRRPRRRQDH